MEQVKLFAGTDTVYLEEKINAWLKENEGKITILHRGLAVCVDAGGPYSSFRTVISIHYISNL